MNPSDTAGSPWYRNFWPWFIVGLLGVSVIGSLATVYVAFLYGDEEVDRHSVASPSVPGLAEGD